METFSALLTICAENSPVPGEFPAQRPVTRNFDVFFDLRLNKRLSKQWWGWWFETLSHPLWRHRNAFLGLDELFWRKWQPFSRRDLQMHFEWKLMYFGLNFTECHFQRLNSWSAGFDHPIHWPIYASPCFIDLQLNLTAWHGGISWWRHQWKHFTSYWPFVRGTTGHRWIPLTKGQWRGALMFSLICAWTSNWANNQNDGDLKRHFVHYGVTVMYYQIARTSTRPMKYLDLWQGTLFSMWKDITLGQTGVSVRCLFSSAALATPLKLNFWGSHYGVWNKRAREMEAGDDASAVWTSWVRSLHWARAFIGSLWIKCVSLCRVMNLNIYPYTYINHRIQTGTTLCMRPANGRRPLFVMSAHLLGAYKKWSLSHHVSSNKNIDRHWFR